MPNKEINLVVGCVGSYLSGKLIRIAIVGITTPTRGLEALKQHIKEEQVRTSALNPSDITNIDPENWPKHVLSIALGLGIQSNYTGSLSDY